MGFSSDQPKVNLRRLAHARQFQRDRGDRMRDRGAARDADHEPPVVVAHFHQRAVLKFARVPQFGFDEDDRHFVRQPMPAANAGLFFVQPAAAGPVRNQHRKLQMLQAIPQEFRLDIRQTRTP